MTIKILALLTSALFTLSVAAQDVPEPPAPAPEKPEAKPAAFAESMPYFPQCSAETEAERQSCHTEAVMNHMRKTVQYPNIAKENNVEGTVFVSYVIDQQGRVTEVTVRRGVHPALDAEAKRAVEAMPQHVPGMQAGKPIKVIMNVPVRFIMG